MQSILQTRHRLFRLWFDKEPSPAESLLSTINADQFQPCDLCDFSAPPFP